MTDEKEAVKYDEQKSKFNLIPIHPLTELADHYTRGAQKYADRNWEKGLDYSRVYSALQRHITAWWQGESHDSEGFSHLAAVAWCAFALMEYEKTRKGKDDRPKNIASVLLNQCGGDCRGNRDKICSLSCINISSYTGYLKVDESLLKQKIFSFEVRCDADNGSLYYTKVLHESYNEGKKIAVNTAISEIAGMRIWDRVVIVDTEGFVCWEWRR